MLKSHKQNLVPEADFHIREERVKAQKTEGDASTTAKPAPAPAPPTAATEKTTKREKEEKATASQPEEKPPQKIAKVKGAFTATEARAAAAEKEKKQQQASAKEKGEESKSSESASEAVAASATSEPQQPSTPNPELPAASAARREAKTGGNGVAAATSSSASKTSKTTKTKTKEAVSSTATAENGGSNNHHQVKKSAKSEGKSTEEESGSDSSSEKKTTSKGSGKADDKTPKGKPKSLLDKSDGAATPSSRGTSPSNAPSPVMRGAKGTKPSPVVNQNGPTTTATPSPRAGQRRQLSETEVTVTIPEKGEPTDLPFSPSQYNGSWKVVLVFYYRNEETKNRRKSNGRPHKRLCCRYNHVFRCLFFAEFFLCKEFVLFRLLCCVCQVSVRFTASLCIALSFLTSQGN